MRYHVIFEKGVLREMKGFPSKVRNQVIARAESLSENPRPPGSIKLKASDNAWRIRSGDYRIVYEIDEKIVRVLIVSIGHRREVYRHLP